jgi:hypothetical protein
VATLLAHGWSLDGKHESRTDPEFAAARREFFALAPPAQGVLRTPENEIFARVLCGN